MRKTLRFIAASVTVFLAALTIAAADSDGGAYRRTVAQIMADSPARVGPPKAPFSQPRFRSPRIRLASGSHRSGTAAPSREASAAPSGASAPQTLGINFRGATLADTNAFP